MDIRYLVRETGLSSCYQKVHCTFLLKIFGLNLNFQSHVFKSLIKKITSIQMDTGIFGARDGT